jgi:hypothetical protein
VRAAAAHFILMRACVCSYGPHIASIVMLVLMVALKAPIIYDLMVLYQHQSPPILFTCIVVDVVFLFWYRRFEHSLTTILRTGGSSCG